MSRLDATQDHTAYGTRMISPYIEKIYLKNNIANSYDDESREGLEIVISFFCQEISSWTPAHPDTGEPGRTAESPIEILANLTDVNLIVGFVIGNKEISTIVDEHDLIYKHLFKYQQDVTVDDWEGLADAILEMYKEKKYYPPATTDSPDRVPGSRNHAEWIEYVQEQRLLLSSGDIEELPTDVYSAQFGQLQQNFVQISMPDFINDCTESVAYIEEQTSTQYYKFSSTVTIPLTPVAYSLLGDITTFEQMFELLYDSSDQTYRDLEIFALTTKIDWDGIAGSAYDSVEYDYYLANKSISMNLTSKISYENVFEAGVLNDGEQLVYMTSDGAVISETPILTPTGVYRAVSSYDRELILNGLNTVLNNGGVLTDEEQETLDSLSYILSTEAHTVNLLTSLTDYLTVFPDKSTGSFLGSLYGILTRRVASAVSSVENFEVVTQKIVRNIKIIDGRIPQDTEFSIPTPSPTTTDGTINNNNRLYQPEISSSPDESNKGGVYRLLKGTEDSSEEVFEWDENQLVTNYGWFWFDYEKALRNDTNIASVFNIDKLETWFGKTFTNSCLALFTVSLQRFYNNLEFPHAWTYEALSHPKISSADSYYSCWTWERTITAQYRYGSSTGTTLRSWGSVADFALNYGRTTESDDEETYTTAESQTSPSTIILRNLSPGVGGPNAVPDYRLMCFQFYDYYDAVTASEEKITTSDGIEMSVENYRAYVTLKDNSYDVIRHIISTYEQTLNDLQEYYDSATDACSFSTFEGEFTEVFINSMSEKYEDDPQSAPWYRAPIIYNFHKDLLMDTFGSNSSMIVDAASLQTDKINPSYGTLEQLESFLTVMDGFYQQFYYGWDVGTEEDFSDAYTRGLLAELIYIMENTELTYTQHFSWLNSGISSVESEEEYLEESMTAAAYGYMSTGYSGGVFRDAYEISTDTYTRNDLVSFLMDDYGWDAYMGDGGAAGFIKAYLKIIDGLEEGGYGSSTTEPIKILLQTLLTPSGLGFYTYYDAVVAAGGYDAGTLELIWKWGAVNNSEWDASGTIISGGSAGGTYSSLEDYFDYVEGATSLDAQDFLADSELGLRNITKGIMMWVWPAANGTSDTYGSAQQISDFYSFFDIDDSYKPSS